MGKGAMRTLVRRLRQLRQEQATRRFMAHNRRVFPRIKSGLTPRPVVLLEFTGMHSAHIAYSYLANVVAREHGAAIRAYMPRVYAAPPQRFFSMVKRLLKVKEIGVYASFGSDLDPHVVLTSEQTARADLLFDQLYSGLATKDDIVDLNVNGVWIGDLVYDSFLMDRKKATIEIESRDFQDALRQSLGTFVYWEDYLNVNDVRAINVSHCVYNLAIPLRIAASREIPVFQINATHGYRLTPKNLFAYTDFHYFRERFRQLPMEVREAGLEEAARRIKRRFSGEVGVDMRYSTKSAYGDFMTHRLLRESERKKILIATHCFFDSPHSYGRNLFPDFFEWLDFLGKLSEETDYDWYIKTHPDYLPGTMEIIQALVAKYPRFTLLPPDSSHHQIIAEGIDVALTVWGTIGFEYAMLGIPVINASVNNPHVAYDFNFHPRTVAEYRGLLMEVGSLRLIIDKRQVYEYYFMQHIYNTEDWLFDDYTGMIEAMGGYDRQFTSQVYDRWIDKWSPQKHEQALGTVERFVRSGEFRLDYTHAGLSFGSPGATHDT